MLRRLSFDQMTTKICSNVTDVMFLSVDYNIDADDDDNKISVHFALDPKIFHRIMTSCSLPSSCPMPPCATSDYVQPLAVIKLLKLILGFL